MSDAVPETITIAMMRESLYAAVVCDALDALGYRNQSPNVPLPPLTTKTKASRSISRRKSVCIASSPPAWSFKPTPSG